MKWIYQERCVKQNFCYQKSILILTHKKVEKTTYSSNFSSFLPLHKEMPPTSFDCNIGVYMLYVSF